jgi:hypothetical protein
MRRIIQLAVLLPLACSAPTAIENDDEPTSAVGEELLASSQLLWPMTDGKATIRVCFLPLDTGGLTFPLAQYAPNLATIIPERKQWIREGVEAEWNAKTVVQFVGWNDCGTDEADVKIQLITSQANAQCGVKPENVAKGAYCVEDIGSRDKGKRVFINATWGDEVLYSAHYGQTVNQNTYDPSKDVPPSWIPAICQTQVQGALQFGASSAAIDAFVQVQKPCLQNTTVHEFGHVAGFSHEQNRADVTPDCAARYAATPPDVPTDQDTPLGPFDVESIMSYCRAAIPPTLTAEDVSQTNTVYEKLAKKTTTTQPPGADAGAQKDAAGGAVGPSDEGDVPVDPKKKGKTVTTTSGGCNPR